MHVNFDLAEALLALCLLHLRGRFPTDSGSPGKRERFYYESQPNLSPPNYSVSNAAAAWAPWGRARIEIVSRDITGWTQKVQVKNGETLVKAVMDRPNGTPLVTVCNHISYLDDVSFYRK